MVSPLYNGINTNSISIELNNAPISLKKLIEDGASLNEIENFLKSNSESLSLIHTTLECVAKNRKSITLIKSFLRFFEEGDLKKVEDLTLYLQKDPMSLEFDPEGFNPKEFNDVYLTLVSLTKEPKHISIIKLLLEHFDLKTIYGVLLHHAIRHENIELVQFLMEEGADIEETFRFLTPLCIAVSVDREDIVELLLKAGAQIDRGGELCPIAIAIKEYKHNSLKAITKFVNNPNHGFFNDWTMLHIAAFFNNCPLILDLIKRGADIYARAKSNRALTAFRFDTENLAPYDVACWRGHLGALKIFYEARKNQPFEFDTVMLKDLMEWTHLNEDILNWIDNYSHKKVEEIFFDRHAQEFYDSFGKERVLVALNRPSTLLLDQETHESTYILHFAAKKDNAFLIADLLKSKADPCIQDRKDHTPIAIACLNDSMKALDAFHEAGIDVNNAEYHCPESGRSLAHFATIFNKPLTLKWLDEKGYSLDERNSYGETPLFLAAKKGYKDIAEGLLKASVEVNARCDKKGATPLQVAVWNDHSALIRLLLEKGADIETPYGEPPETLLDHVIKDKRYKALSVISHFFGLNHKFRQGFTMLHFAAYFNDPVLVALLIRQGADEHTLSDEGLDPFAIASQWDDHKALKALIREGKAKDLQTCSQTLSEETPPFIR